MALIDFSLSSPVLTHTWRGSSFNICYVGGIHVSIYNVSFLLDYIIWGWFIEWDTELFIVDDSSTMFVLASFWFNPGRKGYTIIT